MPCSAARPAAAVLGGLAAWTASTGTAGTVLVAAVLAVLAAVIYRISRRKPVTATTVNEDQPAPREVATPARVAA